MKIRFKQTCQVKDGSGTVFEADHVYDLPEASAEHWLRRGKAEKVVAEGAAANPAKALEDADETKKTLDKKEAAKKAEAPEKAPEPSAAAAPAPEKEAAPGDPDLKQTREGVAKPDALSSADIKKKK